jgi:hypothetical protein
MTDELFRRRVVVALAGILAADGAFDATATEWIRNDLARLRLPYALHRAFPPIKFGAAAGLLLGRRHRPLGRLTATLLIVYFVLATTVHTRAGDGLAKHIPALVLLAWSTAALMTFEEGAAAIAAP